MQIVGSSFTDVPDVHRLLQQSQSAHLMGSQVARGSGDVADSSRSVGETFVIAPQSVGGHTGEPSKSSSHYHKGVVQADQTSTGNLQVMHLKVPLKLS